MSWIELKLVMSEAVLEKVSSYIFAMGCEGMNVRENEIIVYYNQHKWSEEVRFALVQYIQHFEPSFTENNIKISAMADQDWNQVWRENFRLLRLTNRIVVKPPWEKYRGLKGEIVVTINPKMAFGTGHHESTQLIIELLEKYIDPESSVFDVGTGSGILAIIAEKLGAEKIIAIDKDTNAIKNAHESLVLNKCKKIRLFPAIPEYLDYEEFDLVLANINRNELLKYAALFPLFMKINAKIILSGILLMDENIIIKTFLNNGFKLISKTAKKDWLSVVFELIKKEQKK